MDHYNITALAAVTVDSSGRFAYNIAGETMKRVGAHVSAEGGVQNAPLNAAAIGAKAFALFTKNQRQWQAAALGKDQISLFKENCRTRGFDPRHILPHDTYLINLGNPEKNGLAKSRHAFSQEMKRCQQLGLVYLNFHPGNHKNLSSEAECLKRIAESVNRALSESEGVTAVVENTSGQGSAVGYRFEHLRDLIGLVKEQKRIGVCLDTCHAFSAGYDLRDKQAYERTMKEFDRIIGLRWLKALHLNDSKALFASRIDRHQNLGKGELGLEPFRLIMNDPRLDELPMILETIDETLWPEEIKLLYSLISG